MRREGAPIYWLSQLRFRVSCARSLIHDEIMTIMLNVYQVGCGLDVENVAGIKLDLLR